MASHLRSDSTKSLPSGASYQLILEHIFAHPATYELPLRTVFAQNAGSKMAPNDAPEKTHASFTVPPFSQDTHQLATAEFTSSLLNHISQLPSQPCSLPPVYVSTFLRRCFPPELSLVDFPQSLTGLDYLKDLEQRRRRDIQAVFRRAGINENTLSRTPEMNDLKRKEPGMAAWIDEVQAQEKKVEAVYTQVYVALRRWILVNELSIQPFNRHNCLAMLNTLYPPMISSQPTSKLTPEVLKQQRDGFFRYIQSVEKHGPRVVEPLMQQGKRPGDENGWMAARSALDTYLRAAQKMIDDCAEIQSPEDLDSHSGAQHPGAGSARSEKRKQRKADSGVSFNSTKRPSTSGSVTGDINKPLPASPPPAGYSGGAADESKSYSTIEKIARELRRIKVSRGITSTRAEAMILSDADKEQNSHSRNDSYVSASSAGGKHATSASISSTSSHQASSKGDSERGRASVSTASGGPNKNRSLRKPRSFNDIKTACRSVSPFGRRATHADEAFDKEEMLKQRKHWEQTAGRKDSIVRL